MLRKKLLLLRLAYVPWLLAVCLVLGWSGEAVANDDSDHNANLPTGHPHATNPNLVLTRDLNSTDSNNDGTPDQHSVIVNWSTSQSRNFATRDHNGNNATEYTVNLYQGEMPENISEGNASNFGTAVGGSTAYTDDTRTHTFTHADIHYRGEDDDNDPATDPADGKYWVRMVVEVSGDGESDVPTPFGKQIVVQPDYVLSVNPSSVREDSDATTITVTASVGDGMLVKQDTDILLTFDNTGLNERWRGVLSSITIENGKSAGSRTFVFTPVKDEDSTTDLPIAITGRAQPNEIIESTQLLLIDTDKPTTEINLSFSHASLSKNDPTTGIVVTATLNGDKVRKDLRIPLVIDEVATEATGIERDVDYSAVPSTLIIPDRRVSGKATIVISPMNKGTGSIWVKAGGEDLVYQGQTITVNPNFILLTDTPGASVEDLTATPYSIREDAGAKEVTLEITLDNAVSTDETVTLTIDPIGSDRLTDARYDGAIDAKRDIDYFMTPPKIFIPKGDTKGSTTVTFTPLNNTDENVLRVVTIVATLKGSEVGRTGILITDDDSTSEHIKLTASPDEINEGAGPTQVTVTGTLQGKTFGDDLVVFLIIDVLVDGAATRDIDYITTVTKFTIPSGATQGTTTFTVTPIDNDGKDDNEIIRITGLESQKPSAEDEFGDIQELNVGFVDITLRDSGADVEEDGEQVAPADPTKPSFADATIDSQTYTVGTAIDPLVLPEAVGGDAPLIYSLSPPPGGLRFDRATRTLTGTPTAATDGAVKMVYTVLDSTLDAKSLAFTIAVNKAEVAPPTAETGDAQITATPSAVREDGGTTQVSLRVTLAAAKAIDEVVTFTIVAPSEGTQAVRDVDYTATLGALVTIPKGSTVGTTTLSLSPINNTKMDSLRAIGVLATFGSGGELKTDIRIADDETPSTAIALSVSQDAISEDSGQTSITVTATLNGGALKEDKIVILAVDASSTATRDVDYVALFGAIISIPAGSIEGTTQFVIQPTSDTEAEGSEMIKLTATATGLAGDEVEITISDPGSTMDDMDDPDDPDDSSLAFSNTVANQEYTSGETITPLVLPEATGGTPPFTYSLSTPPAGLSFVAATRTISGTPTAVTEGALIMIYTVLDSAGGVVALTFTITVNEELTFGDFFDLFGSGKVVPTALHDATEISEFIVGQRVEGFVLPEASGGTAPLTYSLSPALPAGLTFDAVTRTIAGTPRAAAETVYTYTVADANGATASLLLQTLPTAFSLADNFPNPFNPTTTIQYALPQAADVELTVYNIVGQPIRTLVAEHQSAGRYAVEWDATNDSGHSLSSGMYFYRLETGGEFREVKKMLLIK